MGEEGISSHISKKPLRSVFMCPCHDQTVMQSPPTLISGCYLLYFNFYKFMFCYFKMLQLKACLDRKMWQILPLLFKTMHFQVLKCSYCVIDFDDNHSCSWNIWSEKCQVCVFGLKVVIMLSFGFALGWSPVQTPCVACSHLLDKVHKPAQCNVPFMTNFIPPVTMTSLSVLSSPLRCLQLPPLQTPLQQQMLSNFHCWPGDLALCWKAVAALNPQILLLVYLRQWRVLIPWLIKCLPWTWGIGIINQTSW